MAYFDIDGLTAFGGRQAVLQLLDPDNTGTADATLVARLQVRTAAILNGYFSRNYDIATIETAVAADELPLVEMLAVEVAMHIAYLAKPEFMIDGKTKVQATYDNAMSMLKQIGEGKLRLDINGAPQTPANARAGGVRSGTYNNVAVDEGFIKSGTGSGGF